MTIDSELYAFEKGWRIALGYVRKEGLKHFDHAEQTLSENLDREAVLLREDAIEDLRKQIVGLQDLQDPGGPRLRGYAGEAYYSPTATPRETEPRMILRIVIRSDGRLWAALGP